MLYSELTEYDKLNDTTYDRKCSKIYLLYGLV